jgi:hypothetical protein
VKQRAPSRINDEEKRNRLHAPYYPAQRLDGFPNSIREKNTLVLGEQLEVSDELYRSEKPL